MRRHGTTILASAGAAALLAFGLFATGTLAGNGETFDAADLRDGETRIFGAGDKQVTATREGDVITIARTDDTDAKPVTIHCRVGSDTCKIITADGGDRLMIEVEQRRECVDGRGDCADEAANLVFLGESDGEPTIIRKRVRCDGEDCEDLEWISGEGGVHEIIVERVDCDGEDCAEITLSEVGLGSAGEAHLIVARHGGDGREVVMMPGGHGTRAEVIVSGDGDGTGRKVRLRSHGARLLHLDAASSDDLEAVDLSELNDGETRIFGQGEEQLTAVRSGDRVTLERPAAGDRQALSLACDVDRDTCRVMTGADGEHVMIEVRKRRACDGGSDDCAEHDVDLMRWVSGEGHAGKRVMVVDTDDCAFGEDCGREVRKIEIRRYADED